MTVSGDLPKEIGEVLARVRRYGEEHPAFVWVITIFLFLFVLWEAFRIGEVIGKFIYYLTH